VCWNTVPTKTRAQSVLHDPIRWIVNQKSLLSCLKFLWRDCDAAWWLSATHAALAACFGAKRMARFS
jgi:hypothetical protein